MGVRKIIKVLSDFTQNKFLYHIYDLVQTIVLSDKV